jgi:hypothetical protein
MLPQNLIGTNATTQECRQRQHILSVLDGIGWVMRGPSGARAVLDSHPNILRSSMNRLKFDTAHRAPTAMGQVS